jgi:hypothetical protein
LTQRNHSAPRTNEDPIQLQRSRLRLRPRAVCRLRGGDRQVTHAAKLLDRRLSLVLRERLAVPVVLIFNQRGARALLGFGDDHRRDVAARFGPRVRRVDLVQVVAVHYDGAPAERLLARLTFIFWTGKLWPGQTQLDHVELSRRFQALPPASPASWHHM